LGTTSFKEAVEAIEVSDTQLYDTPVGPVGIRPTKKSATNALSTFLAPDDQEETSNTDTSLQARKEVEDDDAGAKDRRRKKRFSRAIYDIDDEDDGITMREVDILKESVINSGGAKSSCSKIGYSNVAGDIDDKDSGEYVYERPPKSVLSLQQIRIKSSAAKRGRSKTKEDDDDEYKPTSRKSKRATQNCFVVDDYMDDEDSDDEYMPSRRRTKSVAKKRFVFKDDDQGDEYTPTSASYIAPPAPRKTRGMTEKEKELTEPFCTCERPRIFDGVEHDMIQCNCCGVSLLNTQSRKITELTKK